MEQMRKMQIGIQTFEEISRCTRLKPEVAELQFLEYIQKDERVKKPHRSIFTKMIAVIFLCQTKNRFLQSQFFILT